MEQLGLFCPPGYCLHTDTSGYLCCHGDPEAGRLLDLDPAQF